MGCVLILTFEFKSTLPYFSISLQQTRQQIKLRLCNYLRNLKQHKLRRMNIFLPGTHFRRLTVWVDNLTEKSERH